MDLHYKREITVGSLVIVAALLFVAGTMWLRGKSFAPDNVVTIQFADIANLKEASAVRISGVELGKVQTIEFLEPGRVLVTAALDRPVALKRDATARIFTVSLAAGDNAIALDPGESAEPLPEGAVIMGESEVQLGELMGNLSARAESVLVGVQALVSPEMTRRIDATMASLERTLGAAEATMRLYSDPNRGPSAELTRTMTQFRSLSAEIERTLANPGLQNALSRSDSLTAGLQAMSEKLAATGDELQELLDRINRGEGTLGKFATDSALYFNMVRATAQLDSLMAAIKENPGKIPVTVRIF